MLYAMLSFYLYTNFLAVVCLMPAMPAWPGTSTACFLNLEHEHGCGATCRKEDQERGEVENVCLKISGQLGWEGRYRVSS